MAEVTLREVTRETVRAICRLEVGPGQERFVAPNSVSIAEAYFQPRAWFRAICADDEPVGFVMLYEDEEKGEYYLWRLMIAAGHQRRGYGEQTLGLVVERLRSRPGARELLTSCVPAEGGPRPFYERLGFVPTGDVEEGEEVLRLSLD